MKPALAMLVFPGLLVLSGCTSIASQMMANDAEYERQRAVKQAEYEKERAAENNVLVEQVEQALLSGKSLVVMPLFNSTTMMKRQGVEDRDFSRTVEWQNTNNPKMNFSVGRGEGVLRVTLGEIQQLTVVDPGTYKIASSTYEERRASVSGLATKPVVRDLGIGKVIFTDTQFTELRNEPAWQSAKYATERVRTDYCTVAHVSGACVAWGTATQDVERQTQAAGWYNSLQSVQEDGLYVTLKPSKDFASFTIAPGEVLLVDGFFSKIPNGSYANDECTRIAGNQIQCELTAFELQRLHSSIDQFNADISSIKSSPKLAEILSKAKYGQLKIYAKPGWEDSTWGQNYFLPSSK